MFAPTVFSAAVSFRSLIQGNCPCRILNCGESDNHVSGYVHFCSPLSFSSFIYINALGVFTSAVIRKTRIDPYQYEHLHGKIPSSIQSVFLPFRRNSGYKSFRILQAKYFINHIIRYFKHKINLSFIFFFCS